MTGVFDQLNQQYAGIISIGGILLAIASFIVAVYFYFNPRQSSFHIKYKVFSRDTFGFSVPERWRAEKPEKYDHYIDVWNAGKETIKDDIIREKISVSLQTSTKRDAKIVGIEIEKESHPSISDFSVELGEGNPVLRWRHFDPGMGVRLRVWIDERVPTHRLIVFGGGLRLRLRRVRELSERGGAINVSRWLIVWGVPLSVLTFGAGQALGVLQELSIPAWATYLAALGVLFLVAIAFILSLLFGFGVNEGIEYVFNARSPIEHDSGRPHIGVQDFSLPTAALSHLGTQDLELIARSARMAELEGKTGPLES